MTNIVLNEQVLVLNSLFGHRIPVKPRLFVCLFVVVLLFAVTAGLSTTDSDDWQQHFLGITLLIVVVINACGATFQGNP